jgi:hypothetical protein
MVHRADFDCNLGIGPPDQRVGLVMPMKRWRRLRAIRRPRDKFFGSGSAAVLSRPHRATRGPVLVAISSGIAECFAVELIARRGKFAQTGRNNPQKLHGVESSNDFVNSTAGSSSRNQNGNSSARASGQSHQILIGDLSKPFEKLLNSGPFAHCDAAAPRLRLRQRSAAAGASTL